MKKRSRKIKFIAIFLLTTFLFEIFTPTVAFALTSGPSSPEFSSFEPVATTNMVDPFTGTFTYNIPILNIPGPDGSDYALSLSYHSGATCEDEASWVGYGWTLNPGAINKNVKGIPDEYNGENVTYYNKMRPNWSISATLIGNLEGFGKDFGLSATECLKFNNYQGFARSYTFGLDFKGWANIGMNVDAAGVTFNAGVNFSSIVSSMSKKSKAVKRSTSSNSKTDDGEPRKKFASNINKNSLKNAATSTVTGLASPSSYMIYSAIDPSMPTNVNETRGFMMDFYTAVGVRPAVVPIGYKIGYKGSFTLQWNKLAKVISQAYGYNYHNSYDVPLNTNSGNDYITDYNVERSQMFDKQDLFLGIPFASPDQYIVATEGLGGSFRPYSLVTNIYFPQNNTSKHYQIGTGVEFNAGTNMGLGISLGLGYSNTVISRWEKPIKRDNKREEYYDVVYQPNPEVFYRFSGDKGGNISFGNTATPNDEIYKSPNFPGISKGNLVVEPENYRNTPPPNTPLFERNSSSYIKAYDNCFSIFNESGVCYTFGEVIKSTNEANISINYNRMMNYEDIETPVLSDCKSYAFKKLYLDGNYDMNVDKHMNILGDVKKTSYNSTYLLTSITNSNYIDAGVKGIDDADFGGWTKFRYTQVMSSTNNGSEWYRWRNPYFGLNYSQNEISNKWDDMASVSTGERQVKYLTTIETKTHIAKFILEDRDDAMGVKKPSEGYDPCSNSTSSNNRDFGLKKLSRIELYVKGPNNEEKLLKTVHFEYSYSLVPNVPNNKNSTYPNNNPNPENAGKLTLKRVWTEYNGVINAKISPYVFEYAYKEKKDFPAYLTARFTDNPNVSDDMYDFFNLSEKYKSSQNPAYSPSYNDGWGNIQYDAKNRNMNSQKFVYQGEYDPNIYFDPAAWQLKQIKLPSGGEILIEYEQNDYSYVQDRNAMAMVSLLNPDNSNSYVAKEEGYGSSKYVVNMADLGYDPNEPGFDTEMGYYVDFLNEYFKNEKIYYKFLYDFKGRSPSLDNMQSEYITGYTTILNENGIEYITNENGVQVHKLVFHLDRKNFGGGNVEGPRQTAYDFYCANRVGMFEGDERGKYYLDLLDDGITERITQPEGISIGDAINVFCKPLEGLAKLSVDLLNPSLKPLPKEFIAQYYNTKLSYLKLPLPEGKSKRGGGIRVKRLLMYDDGIENGDAAIYGNEYTYKTTLKVKRNINGSEKIVSLEISSGVATNEPLAIHEENALVGFLPKKNQTWIDRMIAGTNKESSEGPIGESILPGPSIGYSNVKVKNIYSGKTGTGYTLYEYYTVKDFPFDKVYEEHKESTDHYEEPGNACDYTNLTDNTKDDYITIPAGIFNYTNKKVWASQGYKFVLTDFHGLIKSEISYDENNNLVYAMSKEYFNPGEKVRMMKGDNTGNNTWEWVNPGKEMDIAIEDRTIKTSNFDFQTALDISIGVCTPPPPFVTAVFSFTMDEKQINTHVVSKVIHYPVIEKSTTIYKDGIKTKTENLAFDYATCNPILTKTYDAYNNAPKNINGNIKKHDGSIYSFTIPAHWMYHEMGRKSENVAYMNDLKSIAGSIVTYGENGVSDYKLNSIGATSPPYAWSFPVYENSTFENCYVLSASVTTYEKGSNMPSWLDNSIQNEYNYIPDPVNNDFDKKYRPYRTYVYKTDVTNKSTDVGCKIYEEGLFKKFIRFDFASTNNGTEWVKISEITKYSPGGLPLEEKDVQGIYSAALYGESYRFSQPIMIAKNAERSEIRFYDFENETNNDYAHSGSHSKLLSSELPFTFAKKIVVTNHLFNKGATLLFWAKGSVDQNDLKVNVNSSSYATKKIAQTGDWTLFQSNLVFTTLNSEVDISISTTSNASDLYIDDVRFQPSDAKCVCYVYDKGTLKLLTQFDDQHFGLFYQYNAEGQLVRKMIETEKGMKTLQETQYNIKTIPRTSL